MFLSQKMKIPQGLFFDCYNFYKNKNYSDYEIYYMGQNYIDNESQKSYEIDKIEVYDAKVKTTVFKRKTIKTVKMIDFYWKGKDK